MKYTAFGCGSPVRFDGERMANEKQLREDLISAFELLQKQNSVLHDLLNEVASIRDALIEIGPGYKDILDRHRARGGSVTMSLQGRDSHEFDAIIRRLKIPS
jgi:hypothetical protein